MHDFTVFERFYHHWRTLSREAAIRFIGNRAPTVEGNMQEFLETLLVAALGFMMLIPILAQFTNLVGGG